MLARHKRLVHTKPEDREPPKKRGRPPKSSYTTEGNQRQKNSSGAVGTPASMTVGTPEMRWPDVQDASERSAQAEFHFPKLNGETQNGAFLSNDLLVNFGLGSLDTLSEFNFAAEQDILSFLNPARTTKESATVYDPATATAAPHGKPVILQPDFVDWLQMNRDDAYSFSMQQSSPRGLESSTAPVANLIEPNENKEVLVNPSNPNTSISIDEQTYANIQQSLKTIYKVFFSLNLLTVEQCVV